LQGFTFTFIELPKFTKDNVMDLETYEEKWRYFATTSPLPNEI
jgi:hypothetical protein